MSELELEQGHVWISFLYRTRLLTNQQSKKLFCITCDVQQHHYCTFFDDINGIREVIKEWSNSDSVDWVITMGGTGFGQRDVTPEVRGLGSLYYVEEGEIFRPSYPSSNGMHQAWFILRYLHRFNIYL